MARVWLLMGAVLLVAACGSDEAPPVEPGVDVEAVVGDMAATLDDMIDVLAHVKSESDIETLKPRLRDIAARLKVGRETFDRMSSDEQGRFRRAIDLSGRRQRSRDARKRVPKPLMVKLEAAMAEAMRSVGGDPALFR